METFAKRLKERAKQLGISNAEAGRRAGLDEGRYGHYISGRNVPDFATLVRIANVLATTPNWLLGIDDPVSGNVEISDLINRLKNAALTLTPGDLRQFVLQIEAIAADQHKGS